jgi:fibro-slime domain-containing protein
MLLKKKWLGLLILLSIICTGILHFSCGNLLSGPSIVGNPSVSATIVDEEGVPLDNIPIILLPVNHNIVSDTNLNKFAKGVTDNNGTICLVNVQFRNDSAFNLTSTDPTYRYRLIKRIRSADTATPDKSINLSTIRLETPGAIRIRVDSISFKTGYALTIPGTSIVETVAAPGVYILSAPAGAYTVNYTNASPLANNEHTAATVKVTLKDTATITVNNFITTRTIASVLLKDQIPDTLQIYTNADTIGPNRIDTLTVAIDTNLQKYTIINTDTTVKKDTVLLGRGTIIQSDTLKFTHDTLVTVDTLKKRDSIFTVYTTLIYNKYTKVDTMRTIDTIIERDYGHYIVHKQLSGSILLRKLLLEFSCPVLQPSQCIQRTYFDTLLYINTSKTFDTTIQGDTIYFRDSTRLYEKKVMLDTIKKGDTTLWKDTILITDSIRQNSSEMIIDTVEFRDSLRNVITNVSSDMKTITDTLLFQSDTAFSMLNYPDTIMIPVTYYDFHSDGSNPEFEQPHPTTVMAGMVDKSLDASGKPVAGPNIMMNAYIKYWFRSWEDTVMNKDFTVPRYDTLKGALISTTKLTYDTSFKNTVINDSIKFVKISGSNMYRSENPSFFPLDKKGFGYETKIHNYSFTMQMNMNVFISSDSKELYVQGDNDIWVFINSTLAIDLGGIHDITKGSCSLSNYMISGEKKIYPVSLFLAQRHSSQKGSFYIDVYGLRP